MTALEQILKYAEGSHYFGGSDKVKEAWEELKSLERDYLKLRQEHSAMKAKLEIAKEALDVAANELAEGELCEFIIKALKEIGE